MNRPLSLCALIAIVASAPAGAQTASKAVARPAAAPVSARPVSAKPVNSKAASVKPAARAAIKAPVKKAPVAALEDRGSNPRGPFALLTEPQRDSIIANARGLLGIKYKWAGETPERGVDCSGLVRYVFAKLGIDLPHSSRELAKLGGMVAKDTADMQPGDLLVFSRASSKRISHVAIYVGDGMMIHASTGPKQVVETPVMEYNDVMLRGVRRVIALDTTSAAQSGSPGIKN